MNQEQISASTATATVRTFIPGELPLIIEGKSFTWDRQYITGLELKQLRGLPATAQLFLSIAAPWKDEPVNDEDTIDLARPDIEQFFTRKNLEFFIGETRFESDRQYIRGSRIKELGNIPTGYDVYLQIAGPWEDELIKDDEWVDLARPGAEHFTSRKTIISVTLVVNGRPKHWTEKTISFSQAIALAFDAYNPAETKAYTVTYKNGPKENPQGSMVKGQTVIVKEKMIFNVTCTDRS